MFYKLVYYVEMSSEVSFLVFISFLKYSHIIAHYGFPLVQMKQTVVVNFPWKLIKIGKIIKKLQMCYNVIKS